jgi:uncharacterized protein (UPF0332 family)
MDNATFMDLAVARMYRAGELLEEAIELLVSGKYKSANNRAFYSMEKCMKALLAVKGINADSHNGCLSQFNVHYIKPEIYEFHRGDYKEIASVERIRNNSDYDDFYIADKEECQSVVISAKHFYVKTLGYLGTYREFEEHMDALNRYAAST